MGTGDLPRGVGADQDLAALPVGPGQNAHDLELDGALLVTEHGLVRTDGLDLACYGATLGHEWTGGHAVHELMGNIGPAIGYPGSTVPCLWQASGPHLGVQQELEHER